MQTIFLGVGLGISLLVLCFQLRRILTYNRLHMDADTLHHLAIKDANNMDEKRKRAEMEHQ